MAMCNEVLEKKRSSIDGHECHQLEQNKSENPFQTKTFQIDI